MSTVWVSTVRRLIAIEQTLATYLEPTPACDLTPRQAHVLAALYAEDKQNPSALARDVALPPTSLTPLVDSLANAGFIRREPDPYDRRAVLVCLTPSGEALRSHITHALQKIEEAYS